MKEYGVSLVAIEKVHSMPRQGLASTFKFGKGYGQILGVLSTLEIPYVLVTPQQWKKIILNGYPKGDKTASIQYCKAKYPNVSLTKSSRATKDNDGIADAICIMEYAIIQDK